MGGPGVVLADHTSIDCNQFLGRMIMILEGISEDRRRRTGEGQATSMIKKGWYGRPICVQVDKRDRRKAESSCHSKNKIQI